MDKTSNLIIKYRWLVLLLILSVVGYFFHWLPKTEMDPDMQNQLPETMHSRMSTDSIEAIFGGTETVMIILENKNILNEKTLRRVKKLSRALKRTKGIDQVLSLTETKRIYAMDNAMYVDPCVDKIPKTSLEFEETRKNIIDNDMVYGSIISEDFTKTAVIGITEADLSDEYIIGELEKIISKYPGDETTLIGGVPFQRLNVSNNMKQDLGRLLPLGLIIMLFFLYFCFRQIRGVFLPFIVVVMSILFSMGFMPIFGWKISSVSIILPVILIAVANDYGIHMISKYQEDNYPGNTFTKKELSARMFKSLGKPILLTGLTTMAGMLCLLGHILISAEQLGILAALGILFALLASLFFIPAFMSFLPKAKPLVLADSIGKKKPFMERILLNFGHLITGKTRKVIIAAVIFSVVASAGIFFIQVDANPLNYFSEEHPVKKVGLLINRHLGGYFNLSIRVSGDLKDPDVLKRVDQLEKEINALPEVGTTRSIARVIRQISRALFDKSEGGYDKIPETRNACSQFYELYSMSGDSEDLEKLIDFKYENALINVRFNKSSTPDMAKGIKKIKGLIGDDTRVKHVGGIAYVFNELAEKVIDGQFISLFIALLVVFILLSLLFKSTLAGVFSTIPLALSLPIIFGLMGIFRIELNIATALLSSVMIGVGIDYTIHFIWRYQEEREEGLNHHEAVYRTLETTGRGITFNAFSVIIGFIPLIFSTFIPVRFFGFLVIVSIFACYLGALVIIPALIIQFKPRFLEPTASDNIITKS